MNNERIYQLSDHYLDDTLLPEEWVELKAYLQNDGGHAAFEAALMHSLQHKNYTNADPAVLERILQRVYAQDHPPAATVHRIHFFGRNWLRYAAIILVVLAAGFYFWTVNRETKESTAVVNEKGVQEDILPGKNRALLTLANGQQIVLDSVQGKVIKKGNLTVVNLSDVLKYEDEATTAGKGTAVEYNTLSTPKGGQYQIVLSDGTRVWLNAGSSIRYPTVFIGNERQVEIHGEAYFEIAKNTKRPFRVNVANKAEVKVLGTHFNVNAYENETGIYTTLLEGSIKVQAGHKTQPGKEVILQPGDQAQLLVGQNTQPALEIVNNADLDQVMAWKNGLFDFHTAGLEEVMRQLERWYDVEVIYESTVPDVKLRGKMTRDVTLNGLLKNLGKLGVHCRLEGRKVVVLP